MREKNRKSVLELQTEGVLLVEDGNHGENRPRKSEFAVEGMAFVRAADMRDGSILFDVAEKIDEVAQARVRKGIGRSGDILISHKGTIGRVARAHMNAPAFVCSPQTTFWRVLDETVLDRDYLYALMRSPRFQSEFAVRSGETDMAGYVSLTSQRHLELELPSIETQRWIGRTIAALDVKIELNRRMNETLEAMGRAIFRDWFVDFGPTRAKMEGREPYLAPDPWALFPDRLDDDGKPEGWETQRVEDTLQLVYGKALRASDRIPGPIPVYGSGGITGYHNEALAEAPSIIVGRKGTVGSLYWEDEPFFPIDTVFYVKPKAPLSFCFYLLQSLGLESMNTDAAVPGLNRNNVYRLSAPNTQNELPSEFDKIVGTLREKIRVNISESRTLAATRDLLLPKLMSGEIRAAGAEALADEAVAGDGPQLEAGASP